MIQPEELRIGNLITINNPKYRPNEHGKIAFVSGIKEKTSVHFQDSTHVIELKGKLFGISQFNEFVDAIPLNEEWLLKMPRIEMYDYVLRKSGQGLHIELRGVNITTCNYVHEYQNFYYITQGSELTLKQ